MATGCDDIIKIKLIKIIVSKNIKITEFSLRKILTLEVKDRFNPFSEVFIIT